MKKNFNLKPTQMAIMLVKIKRPISDVVRFNYRFRITSNHAFYFKLGNVYANH